MWFSREPSNSEDILETGWQFHHRPTTVEPVGTVFRIDKQGKRHMVDKLNVATTAGPEAGGRIEQAVDAGAGVMARIFGLENFGAKAKASKIEKIVFEVREPERKFATDIELQKVVEPFCKKLEYRADSRYFVIRDCRSGTGMTHQISKERLGELGGEAKVNEAISVGATLSAKGGNIYDLNKEFGERMDIMFLPDEIGPTATGLGGGVPELGLLPVKEVLFWTDKDD
jgi:hypothetical protein